MPQAKQYGDHPRRCKARSMHTGEQCGRWALKGREYCQFHGGRSGRRLPRFYNDKLGPKLKEHLEQLLLLPHHEQVSLYEELALARAAAQQAVGLASMAIESDDTKLETRQLAIDVLRDAIGFVRDMVLAASKIEKDAEDKVSVRVVELMINQTIRAVYRALGKEHRGLAEKIEVEIQTSVFIPADETTTAGTDLTPDKAVEEMDRMTAPDAD